jgi:Zn-dependent protease
LPFSFDLASSVMNLIVLVLSLTVHEFFHAFSAWKLGDDTAARMGRLTLNPIPHIDPIGTLLLPLLGAPIGWAKPVPVNPARFHRGVSMGTGDIIVSVAGPLSNLALGLLCAVAFGLMIRFAPEAVDYGTPAHALLVRLMLVNAGLALFNILPIPPLDGGHVAGNLVPYRHRDAWDRYAQVAPFILLALVMLQQTNYPVLSIVLGPPRAFVISGYEAVLNAIGG